MKITLQIEVTDASELESISQALQGLGSSSTASVEHDVTETVTTTATATTKTPSKRGGKKTPAAGAPEKFDAPTNEQMESVRSQYSQGPTAGDVLNMNTQQAPNLVQENYSQQAHQANTFPNAVAHIIETAGKLEKAGQIPGDVKKNVIHSLLQEIQAPQGFTASKLPEPYLSAFASKFGPKVDSVIAQFSAGNALV